MTPYEELRATGKLGPAGAQLLYRAVRAVALARNFPPPEGHNRWDDEAVFEVAHDFLVGERAQQRITELYIRATSDTTFERSLHVAVLNVHRDRYRKTDMGALVLRVREVLEQSDRFELATSGGTRWRLLGGPVTPNGVPQSALSGAVARESNIVVPRWISERRRAPLADRDTFERLLETALKAGDGTMTAADLARVVATRLDPVRVPLAVELDPAEQIAEPAPQADVAQRVASNLRAIEIFNSISDRERILVATWERPVRDLGELLGVRHSQASTIRQRLSAALRVTLADDDDPDGVVGELRALSLGWLKDRTPGSHPTFPKTDDYRRHSHG